MKKYSFIFGLIFLVACSTSVQKTAEYKAPCITNDYENFTLIWGYDYQNNSNITAYQLNSQGKLLFILQDRDDIKEKKIDTLTTIEPERLCEILKQVNFAYVHTPALNETGKKLGFVELKKPAVGFISKATWSEFETYGSRGFRALFDTLSTLITIKKNNK